MDHKTQPETGTLAELNVKPGDVVRHSDGSTYEVRLRNGEPALWWLTQYGDKKSSHGWGVYVSKSFQVYTIVSRAFQPDTPKLLRDMTDEELGALVRAQMQGKALEWIDPNDPRDAWSRIDTPLHEIDNDMAVRIRPEPKRETVTIYWSKEWGVTLVGPSTRDTHRITFDLIDGKPDFTSIRMEEL